MFKWSKPVAHFYEMHFDGDLTLEEQEEFLDVLKRVSNEDAPFVILSLSSGNSPLSIENKKKMNLWFKENRAFLNHMCLGTVRVQPGFSDDHYEGSNMEKGMPFPLFARHSHEEGLKLALDILQISQKAAN